MRKSIPLLLLLIAVVLSACLPQTTATPAATLTATPNTGSNPVPTVALIPPSQQTLPDSGCTVVTKKPTAGPTAASIYPPITETDWVKGPADAKVTIIEYSDFQ